MAGLSSCGAVKADAIRIGDYSMSTKEFEREMQSASKNLQSTTELGGPYVTEPPTVASDTNTSASTTVPKSSKKWNPAFVANELNTVMVFQAIDDEIEAKKLTLKPLDPAVKQQIFQAFGDEKTFNLLPADYQKRQLEITPKINALIASEVANLGSPEEYFAKNKASYSGNVCASHILVATVEEANAVKDRIDKGEDFAKVANEVTVDPSGKGKGGELGCTAPSSYVAEFAAAVSTLEIGQIGGPIQTQFGFHIIKVTKREPATFESAKAKVQSDLESQASLLAQRAVYSHLTKDTVSVNPALGALDTTGEYLRIVAPKTKLDRPSTVVPSTSLQP